MTTAAPTRVRIRPPVKMLWPKIKEVTAPLEVSDRNWRSRAKCVDADSMIFMRDDLASRKEAKKVCAGCPVLADCLVTALANREPACVWGGQDEPGRANILRHAKHQAKRQAKNIA